MALSDDVERLNLALLRLFVIAVYRPVRRLVRWLDRS